MDYTRIEYARQQNLPLVSGALQLGEHTIPAPLLFVVDTAAKMTIITLKMEAMLKYWGSNVAWDRLIKTRQKPIPTVQGDTHFLQICAEDCANVTSVLRPPPDMTLRIWINFKLADGKRTWAAGIRELLFVNTKKHSQGQLPFGSDLDYAILGQDVLGQCGLIMADNAGVLLPDRNFVKSQIEQVLNAP